MSNTTNSKNNQHRQNASLPAAGERIDYALRAECSADCQLMRSVLAPWLTMWREDFCMDIRDDGIQRRIPDVEVQFSVTPDAPYLEELRWLLNILVDCHVGAESLNFIEDYSGDRLYFPEAQHLLRRPTDEAIHTALKSLRATIDLLPNASELLEIAAAELTEVLETAQE